MPVYINHDSIIAKTMKKVNSSEYQNAVKKVIKDARKTGMVNGHSIDIMTEDKMHTVAKIMENLVYSTAAQMNVPGSVLANIAEIEQSGIAYNDDDTKATITLSFVGDNTRPSLQPDKYAGAYDIIGLFDGGWSAGGQVFGMWHGARVGSRTFFQGLNFLQTAIESFNAIYGPVYNCTASMN